MKHVIYVNGFKRSGKDTVGEILHKHRHVSLFKAATPLYKAIQEVFSLSEGEWMDMYENAKEKPSQALYGMTPREAMIWLSEDVMKPKFGDDFFGVSLGKRIMNSQCDVAVVTDSGYAKEIAACMNALPFHQHHLIYLYRTGTTNKGDSREIINPCDLGLDVEHYEPIPNNGTIEVLAKEVLNVTDYWTTD